MLCRLRARLTYANVMSTVAVVVAVGTGSAYAANTVFSTDIADGEVKSVDIGNGEIGSADVKDNSINTFDVHSFLGVDVVDETLTGADVDDGTLEDQDVGQGAFVDFAADIGTVSANSCKDLPISGINAQGDHLLATPNWDSSTGRVIYSIQWQAGNTTAQLQACNPTATNAVEDIVFFNLLVFDAQ